jgi:hypothetical protein
MLHSRMKVENGMAMNRSWQELYKAALLEIEPEQLRRRIDAAEKAISQRSDELRQAGSHASEEQTAVADALRALRVLAQSECEAHSRAGANVFKSDVAS